MLTWSRYSGSDADVSQWLFSKNIFGLDNLWETLWKKLFSYKNTTSRKNYSILERKRIKCLITVIIKVDWAWATSTNTSASKQCFSIHSSKFGVMSTPGESTRTTSSRKRVHLSRGQKIRTSWLSCNFSSHKAWASLPTDCIGKKSSVWLEKKLMRIV